ncbi:hypothetical protein [Streptomyces vinaceus]|uniref:hypothetical protein n=1 Tax=Streptomyces vinaceus TaxID=1960 RepID=UPI0035D58737
MVGTGGTAVPLNLGSPLKDWVFDEGLSPYRAMSAKAAVTAAIGGIHGYELPDVVREDYLASYTGQRFADQLPYVGAYPAELPVLGELLPRLETPVQILAGRNDAVVRPENAEYDPDRHPGRRSSLRSRARRAPRATLHRVPGRGPRPAVRVSSKAASARTRSG